ncbi:hypothetical protein HPP92_021600 [Vanilla planifolia]|uniref:Uncharacterized protein n=1 Tax=Vanilla planifolia TaxID=51239 RepID=A0A835Q4Y2_VANPL|nr:hypothetical protein HPP92_021600 [Vanilla planifolia]
MTPFLGFMVVRRLLLQATSISRHRRSMFCCRSPLASCLLAEGSTRYCTSTRLGGEKETINALLAPELLKIIEQRMIAIEEKSDFLLGQVNQSANSHTI